MDKWYRADRALPSKSRRVSVITKGGRLIDTVYSAKWQEFNICDNENPEDIPSLRIECDYWAYPEDIGPEGYEWTKEF